MFLHSRNTEAAFSITATYPERVQHSRSTQCQALLLPVLRGLNSSNLFYGTWHPPAPLTQRISLLWGPSVHAQPQQIAFPGTRTCERFTGGGRSSVLPARYFIQVGLICLVSHRSKCDTSESWLQVNWGTLIQGWLLEEYPILPFSSGKQADANCTSPCRGKPLLHPSGPPAPVAGAQEQRRGAQAAPPEMVCVHNWSKVVMVCGLHEMTQQL